MKIGVIGSSVKGGSYLDPMLQSVTNYSDVDMTMIISNVDDEEELFRRWMGFRDELKRNVANRLDALQKSGALKSAHGANLADDFGSRVMNSINVYPPDQLVDDVENSSEYVKKLERLFKEYDDPKNFHHVNLGAEDFDAVVGGTSAKAFRKHYEAGSGVVFEMYDGKVIHGFHDLQEVSKFTSEGVAGISGQFVKKSRQALQTGEDAAKDLSKNMKRLNQYLRKAKSMAGVDAASIANLEIDDLLRKLDGYVSRSGNDLEKGARKWLKAHGDEINHALLKADIEARACRAIAETADETQRAMLRKLVSSSKWKRFKNQLSRHYRDFADAVPLGTITKGMTALAVSAEYLRIRDIYAERGFNAAFGELLLEGMFAGLPQSLFKMAFEIAMEEAKGFGYQLAVSRQGCEDFLAGIVSIMGAEKFQKGYELEEFARYFIHEDEAAEKLDALASGAATRSDVETNTAIKEMEAGKKVALLEKCQKPIMTGWRATRQQWFFEAATNANELRSLIEALNLTLEITGETTDASGKRNVEIAVRTAGDAKAIHEKFVLLKNQIARLGGKDGIGSLDVMQHFQWMLDGRNISPDGWPGGEKESLTLLDFNGDSLFGTGRTASVAISNNKSHELALNYRVVFKPEGSIAPEIMADWKRLWGGIKKKAVMPLDPALKPIEIAGPAEVTEGERAGFNITGTGELDKNSRLAWYVIRDDGREEAGEGRSAEIEFGSAGRATVGVGVRSEGAGTGGRAEKQVNVFQPARLSLRLTDSKDGKPIVHADVFLQGKYKGGRNYRLKETDELTAGLSIIPGPYDYRVKAKGYEEVIGTTNFGYSDTVLELELDAADEEPEEETKTGDTGKIDPAAAYIGLSLDHDELILEPGKQGYIVATASVSSLPKFKLVDVTSEVEWESDDPAIATVNAGVVKAGNQTGETFLTARFTSPDVAASFSRTIRISVKDLSANPPEASFAVSPEARTYRPGQNLTFKQTLQPPTDDFEFHWYLNGEDFSGPEISYTFPEEDKYTVTLIVTSKASGREQRFSRSIEVTEEPLPDIGISASSDPPYQAPANISFSATGDDLPDNAQYRWMLDGSMLPAAGRTTASQALVAGSHMVLLSVLTVEDEYRAELKIEVGGSEDGDGNTARPDARWRNRFAASEPDASGWVEISSQYWIGGDGRWSDLRVDNRIEVEGKAHLVTGEQDAGFNTGFLLYVPKGRNELRYSVHDYNYETHRMGTVYSGNVPLHGRDIDPSSVKINSVHSRAMEFEWRSMTGDLGLLRLYKVPAAGFVTGGLEEIDFIEGDKDGGDGINLGNKNWNFDEQDSAGKVQDQAEFDPGRKYEGLPQKLMWSAPPGERAYIYVGMDGLKLHVKMKITGSSDFGYVDYKGYFHDTRGKDVGYLDYAMPMGVGINLMPVVPDTEIEEIIGDSVRFIVRYEFYVEGERVNHDEDSTWSRDTDRSGVSQDGTRLPLQLVGLDKLRRGDPQIVELYWKPAEKFFLRKQPGKLEIRGSGAGTWGERWILVSKSYSDVSLVGTGVGPAVAYKEAEGRWRIKLFEYRTGKVLRDYTRNQPMRIGHGGQYGVYVFVGENNDRFFAVDIYNNRMREYDPKTREYID
ncbi:MAG: PKD domain-containing protein [Nitratireductor sp.]|nr:PKD domain-containing protein [Nitratireductor sp.]